MEDYSTGKINPEAVKDSESAIEYNKLHDILHDKDLKYIKLSNGKVVNLCAFKNQVMKAAEGVDSEEFNSVMAMWKSNHDMIQTMAVLKRKAIGMQNRFVDGRMEAITESMKSNIFEWYGKLYSDEEIVKKLIDQGVPVSPNLLTKFRMKYKTEIEKLQMEYEKDWQSVSITRKRSRLDQLAYIYNKIKQEFDVALDTKQLQYSKEMRAVLDQVKKEVEGDHLRLTVDGKIDIGSTIEMNKTVEELYSSINFMGLLIGRVAERLRINPLVLQHQLAHSWYAEFTGIKRNDKMQELKPQYPSSIVYNWDSIREKNRTRNEKYKKLEEVYDIEDVTIIEEAEDKKKAMQEMMRKKIEELNTLSK